MYIKTGWGFVDCLCHYGIVVIVLLVVVDK